MRAYFDTSALMPLILPEPSTAACTELWATADDVASTHLSYVETAAGLARARRGRRLSRAGYHAALAEFELLWVELFVVDLDEALIRQAAAAAGEFGLRGYDAVQFASCRVLTDVDLVAASGDRELLDAWRAAGIATYDTLAA